MLLEYDMMEPSRSLWACRVVLATKRGTVKILLQLSLSECGDHKYAYPIPQIDENLLKLGDAKFFTRLDLGSCFWQVPLLKKDREKTEFACELGLHQWKRIPFGLSHATATFQ